MPRMQNALSRGADINAINRVSLFHLLYMGKYNIFIMKQPVWFSLFEYKEYHQILVSILMLNMGPPPILPKQWVLAGFI